MIDLGYLRAMAAYNSEMNRRLYAAAGRLSDEVRRAEGGAFWGSIHGTLCHLLWADRMWMSRFDGWERPAASLAESATFMPDFAKLREARVAADSGIEAWVARLEPAWLQGSLTWFSGAAQREMSSGRAALLMHVFNHQTHHRGQAHALLTRAGETTGDTDLWLVVPDLA